MGEKRTDSESQQADEELVQRDLGAGHPLSPGTDEAEQSVPADGDTVQPAAGEGGDTGRTAGEQDVSDPTGHASEDSGLSRRALLLGGGAGAVAASLGWAAVLGVGGGGTPDGAAGVAVAFVEAVADNDWEAAGELYHEDSRFGRSERTYEGFLQENGQFDTYQSITPSIEDHYTFRHITDPERAVEADGDGVLGFFSGNIDPADIEESKSLIVVTSIQKENLNRSAAEQEYLGDSQSGIFSISLVEDDTGWQMVQGFGSL